MIESCQRNRKDNKKVVRICQRFEVRKKNRAEYAVFLEISRKMSQENCLKKSQAQEIFQSKFFFLVFCRDPKKACAK